MSHTHNRRLTPIFVLVLAAGLASQPSRATDAALTEVALAQWLENYKAAWESRDADRAAALFTVDATYQDEAFSPPHRGSQGIRDYWSKVTAGQRDVKFQYQVLSVKGNTGIAHWSAQFAVAETTTTIKLDGVFLLEFDGSGKCRSLREWWHLQSSAPQ
ncbi:MAG: nuclear transport factor 2 family protein [Gammaproteobacteria bacterium]|nr:nuclear transport factor 2 family protein [Gammaproteobacteria bacterium]